MPGFLYFMPHARQGDCDSSEKLSRWGLSYLCDEGQTLFARGCTGLDGQPGMVVGSSANWQVEDVKNSDRIEWVKFPRAFAELQASLGFVKGSCLPGPSDLGRANQISGKALSLADGNRWLIPNARVITANGLRCSLPVSFGLDEETGDWISDQVLPRYRPIWQHANAYLEAKLEAIEKLTEDNPNTSFAIPDGEKLVADALQVNYRVSARELATLGVLVTGLAAEIAEILIDADGLTRLKKKEGNATGAG